MPVKSYFDNGQLQVRGGQTEGKWHGPYERYNEKGQLLERGTCNMGEPCSEWIYGGETVTYEKGRGSTGSEGEVTAAFDGQHGWFWRSRDSSDVTVTIQVRGEYSEFVQLD